MKEIQFEIKSICPLKMDKWIDGVQPKTSEGYQKQAYEKIYRNEKKEISIPSEAIKAAIRSASSELGKKMESKQRKQLISAYLFITPNFLPIGKKAPDCIDAKIVTRKGTGDKVQRVVSYRPLFKSWTAEGTINIANDNLTADFVKQALGLAGEKYGLLSHRPEFGRFVITKFNGVKK